RYDHDFTQERSYYIARVTGEKGVLHLTDEEIAENTSVVWLPIEQALRIISEKEHDNYQRKFIQKRDLAALTEAMLWMGLHDIPGYDSFVKIEPIGYGISSDKKYYIETADGKRFILRISDVSEYDRKKAAFERMKRMDEAGIPMSHPVDFGVCNDGKSVYQLLTWCEGENLEKVLPLLSEAEQYAIGIKVGEIAKKIHLVTVNKNDIVKENWNEQYSNFIDASIKDYHTCGVHVDSEEVIFDYFNNNRHLLKDRPQCYIHGDYHPGNLMLSNEGELAVIDWEIHLFNCYGDPWVEICMRNTSHFSTGMLRGYFNGEPPEEYWRILALYISIGGISAITWAYYHHPELLESRKNYTADVLKWYDNMQTIKPSWYLIDFYIQWIDGVPYKLKAPFDFSFLSKYGTVFKVFDDQGSGNICFGVADGENKFFVKFAGAPTGNYTGTAEDAIERLKRAVPTYQDLAHPNVINLIKAEEIGGGYAAVFDWVDAIHMWTPDGGQEFKNLPLEKHYEIFENILDFHKHMAEKGYSALDFYEDHIMWDLKNERAVICDIDFYSKGWYEGMSGIWNTDCEWYSPEQFIDGAVIDEISCVYVMGITAFALFGDSRDRCFEKWKLSRAMFDVAKKAVNEERSERQHSIAQFVAEWRAVK
ncbi:MAG: phosphotransferase, partial [Eubacteriales bacterium]|nr:phosphotransferase [Eubacteriales bacterium]